MKAHANIIEPTLWAKPSAGGKAEFDLSALSPDAMLILDVGTVLFANPAFWAIFKIQETEQVVGRHLLEFMHADCHDAMALILDVPPDEATNVEQRIIRRDGSVFYAEVASVSITQNGTKARFVHIRDISKTKAVEEALQREREQLIAVFDNIDQPVYVTDPDTYEILYANDTLQSRLGNCVGQKCYKTFHGFDAPCPFCTNHMIFGENTGKPHVSDFYNTHTGRWFHCIERAIEWPDGRMVRHQIAMDITERKQAEERLRQTHELLHSLIMDLPMPVILKDAETLQFVMWNKAAEELSGITEQEAIGRGDHDLFPRELADEYMQNDLQTLKSRTINDIPEQEITSRTKGRRVLHTRKIPVFDNKGEPAYLLAVSEDITEQKQAVISLKESEDKYHTLFEAFPDALFLQDSYGHILECNSMACKLYGFSKQELLGLSVVDIVPEGSAESTPQLLTELLLQGKCLIESRGKKKTGEIFPTEVVVMPLTMAGRSLALVHVRDITVRRAAEEEHRKMEDQILQSQKLESLGVLAGGIAHDFNNLLTAILGYADLTAAEFPEESPLRDNVEQISKTARRAAELTRQMLAYSGRGRFIIQPVHLSKLAADMSQLLEISVSKKSILRFRCAPELPCIQADEAQVRQVLMNLVLNASEAIGDRSGTITVHTGVMDCDQAYLSETYLSHNLAEGRYAFVEVTDTGCGMTADVQAKIFDPFFSTKFTGRGLGLAAVLGIVRGHGGAISVYSEPNKGSAFKVLFPAVTETRAAVSAPTKEANAWHGAATVLVVDDEEIVRTLARKMLENAGFCVITATNGREGVEIFTEHAGDIDLVLLDMSMPHMDGVEAFSEIRTIRPDAKVILASGYNKQDVTERFAGKGLMGFIQKPFVTAELVNIVRQTLKCETRNGKCEMKS